MTEDDDTDVDDISDDNPFCECVSDGYSIEEIYTGVCDYCGKFLDDFFPIHATAEGTPIV